MRMSLAGSDSRRNFASQQAPLTLGSLPTSEKVITALVAVLPATCQAWRSKRLADPVLLISWLLVLWVLRLGRRVQIQSRCLCSPAEAAVEGSCFKAIDGVDVHYVESSSPASPASATAPLLLHLNHGFGANALTWDTVIEPLTAALAARRREGPVRIVAHDRLGFGLSGRPAQLYKYQTDFQAAVALRLLDGAVPATSASPPPPTVLVGHSIGSILSATMAVQQAGSGRVRGLVLIAPAILARARPRPPAPASALPAAAMVAASLAARLARAAVRGVLLLLTPLLRVLLQLLIAQPRFWQRGVASAYGDPQKLEPSMLLRYRWPVQVRGSSEGVLRFVTAQLLETGRGARNDPAARKQRRGARAAEPAPAPAPAEPPLREALAALQLPVLIIHGAKDRLVPLFNSRRLVASMPSASLLELPECGHVPHEESPEEVCRAICEFVEAQGLLA